MHLGLTAPANLLRASRTRAGMATAGAAGPALRRPHRYVDINSYEHRPVPTLDAIQPAGGPRWPAPAVAPTWT
jgi:hypothetical protein